MIGSESFFDVLKSKRKSQNIEISEICEFTKIHPRFIESIEKGDFTILPNVYTRLFLKSYANFIGADSTKALKDYKLYSTGKITQDEKFIENTDEKYLKQIESIKISMSEYTDSNQISLNVEHFLIDFGSHSILFAMYQFF